MILSAEPRRLQRIFGTGSGHCSYQGNGAGHNRFYGYRAGGIGSSNTDKELAALIGQARTETNMQKRASLYHQAVKRAHDQAYFVWLLNIEDIYGMSKRVEWAARVDAKIMVNEMKVK